MGNLNFRNESEKDGNERKGSIETRGGEAINVVTGHGRYEGEQLIPVQATGSKSSMVEDQDEKRY